MTMTAERIVEKPKNAILSVSEKYDFKVKTPGEYVSSKIDQLINASVSSQGWMDALIRQIERYIIKCDPQSISDLKTEFAECDVDFSFIYGYIDESQKQKLRFIIEKIGLTDKFEQQLKKYEDIRQEAQEDQKEEVLTGEFAYLPNETVEEEQIYNDQKGTFSKTFVTTVYENGQTIHMPLRHYNKLGNTKIGTLGQLENAEELNHNTIAVKMANESGNLIQFENILQNPNRNKTPNSKSSNEQFTQPQTPKKSIISKAFDKFMGWFKL
jgi:hypothetical protein